MSLPGIEGFYVGLLHPLSVPGQLMALLSLGVLVGLSPRERVVASFATFAASMLLGIIFGQFGVTWGWEEFVLLLAATLAATLSAIRPKRLYTLSIFLLGIGGFLLGLLSTPDPGPIRSTIITLSGSFVGACIALLYLLGLVNWFQQRFTQQWAQIGLRIVAAWLAAISVLMASLAFVNR
jgi:hydrogenase/urease accessory protein HupE